MAAGVVSLTETPLDRDPPGCRQRSPWTQTPLLLAQTRPPTLDTKNRKSIPMDRPPCEQKSQTGIKWLALPCRPTSLRAVIRCVTF